MPDSVKKAENIDNILSRSAESPVKKAQSTNQPTPVKSNDIFRQVLTVTSGDASKNNYAPSTSNSKPYKVGDSVRYFINQKWLLGKIDHVYADGGMRVVRHDGSLLA